MSLSEQRTDLAKKLQNLPRRHAWVKLGNQPTRTIETTFVDPYHCNAELAKKDRSQRKYFVDPARVQEVKQRYYDLYYRKRDEVILPFDPAWGGPAIRPQRGRP